MKKILDYEKIILASKSPRRLEILNSHGIDPIVIPTDTDESLPDGISYSDAVKMLSLEKATACYEKIKNDEEYRDSLIIAADTVVYTDKLGIMGKPADRDEAYLMLKTIRNTSHFVATGVSLLETDSGDAKTFCDITEVWCKNYSDEDIYEYIDTDEPYDKAGSYAIQSAFGKHIDHIVGEYENVVGLPFNRIIKKLNK